MTATLRATANVILNRVAAEVGLDQAVDPFSSTDKNFVQMVALINTAGEELSTLYPWEFLTRTHTITTDGVTSNFDLPSDFLYMLNQTGWETVNQNPLGGPLSAQEWQQVIGNQITPITRLLFRIKAGQFSVLPSPPTTGNTITFEYVSRNWVIDADDGTTLIDSCVQGGDTPLFDRTLLSRYLKVKWLESKNFDTTKAQADLDQSFAMITQRDKGAPILNAGCGRRSAFIGEYSIPSTGFGS